MFDFKISDRLQFKLDKLSKKDKKKSEIIDKKLCEIIECTQESIQHYKNLKYNLKEYKRVHIDSNFVLIFKVDLENNFILFADLDHHDNIYK